jgi:hypothetical protein
MTRGPVLVGADHRRDLPGAHAVGRGEQELRWLAAGELLGGARWRANRGIIGSVKHRAHVTVISLHLAASTAAAARAGAAAALPLAGERAD